jgi:uncharacterized protein (TIGR02118 family)
VSAKVLVLYERPIDVGAFDEYYDSTHLALVKAIPDLRAVEVGRGQILDLRGASPYYQITTLAFTSMDTLKAAMSSPEGEAALRDITDFATGGATVLMFESQPA